MFAGHYSAAFIAKTTEPRVPLWVLLLAAQFVDVFWAIFVLLGIEKVQLDPTLASNPLVLVSMPYTHSLLGAAVWGSIAGLAVMSVPRLGGTARAGLVVAACVVSHWGLDLLVHRPDLTLWGSEPKLGLSIWNAPLFAYLLELAVLAASAAFYVTRCAPPPQVTRGVAILVGVLFLLQTDATFGPTPPGVTAMVVSVFAVFLGVAYAGFRIERGATSRT